MSNSISIINYLDIEIEATKALKQHTTVWTFEGVVNRLLGERTVDMTMGGHRRRGVISRINRLKDMFEDIAKSNVMDYRTRLFVQGKIRQLSHIEHTM